jgi:hypothetical protein
MISNLPRYGRECIYQDLGARKWSDELCVPAMQFSKPWNVPHHMNLQITDVEHPRASGVEQRHARAVL